MRLNITKAGARKAAGDVLAWAITWLVIVAMGHRSQDSAARIDRAMERAA